MTIDDKIFWFVLTTPIIPLLISFILGGVLGVVLSIILKIGR